MIYTINLALLRITLILDYSCFIFYHCFRMTMVYFYFHFFYLCSLLCDYVLPFLSLKSLLKFFLCYWRSKNNFNVILNAHTHSFIFLFCTRQNLKFYYKCFNTTTLPHWYHMLWCSFISCGSNQNEMNACIMWYTVQSLSLFNCITNLST